MGLILACASAFAVLSCNQPGATGSPNLSNPVIAQFPSAAAASGTSAAPPTPLNVALNWTANHEALVNSAGGGYIIYIYATIGSQAQHGPAFPLTLASVSSGSLPTGMPNPIYAPYNTVTGGVADCSVPTGGAAPSCLLTGLPYHAPWVYSFYMQAIGTIPGASAAVSASNLTAGSLCVTGVGFGMKAGQPIVDSTNGAALASRTVIAAIPGNCAAGQMQLNQAALLTRVGDTLSATVPSTSVFTAQTTVEAIP